MIISGGCNYEASYKQKNDDAARDGNCCFGVSVMGMLFMKGSKTPPASQVPQTASQDEEKNDNPDGNHSGTATTKLAKTDKERENDKVTVCV